MVGRQVRGAVGALGVGILAGTLLLVPSTAQAQDVDSLIASIEAVSQETSARNEEVKELEGDIEDRERDLEGTRGRIADHRRDADEARAAADTYRTEINRIAQAKYRGSVVDPISVAISAENPQNAIDRMSYLGTLTRDAGEVATALHAEVDRATDALDQANRSKAEEDFQLGDLRARLADLHDRQEELEIRKREIQTKVDNLSPEERQLWIRKNGPLDIDPGGFLAGSAASGQAVQAALSKLGSPYGWGAVGPDTFDCSGLIYWAFQQQGKSLPRTSQAQMAGGTPVSRDQLQPGDVIGYYPGATHVGLYIGDGKIVHASDYGIPVQVVSVDSAPFYGARRY